VGAQRARQQDHGLQPVGDRRGPRRLRHLQSPAAGRRRLQLASLWPRKAAASCPRPRVTPEAPTRMDTSSQRVAAAFHECSSGTGSDRAPPGASSSSGASASAPRSQTPHHKVSSEPSRRAGMLLLPATDGPAATHADGLGDCGRHADRWPRPGDRLPPGRSSCRGCW
jgi:hypothetical protein